MAGLDAEAYAALLGYYLGDGHLARARRHYVLRVTCDLAYPVIIEDVVKLLAQLRPGHSAHLVSRIGCVVVQAQWTGRLKR